MSRQQTLKSLETLLESFLDRAVALKEQRLSVVGGIDRLDDIARQSSRGGDITDEMGDWFAAHNKLLTENNLKPADINRINSILDGVKRELQITPDSSPALDKINREISRWDEAAKKLGQKLVLKRGPETSPVIPASTPASDESQSDTMALFSKKLDYLSGLFKDYSANKKHILSVLDDLIKAAHLQINKDALILSGFIIYYLKQNGYKVEPYVKKLKEAETNFKRGALNA